MSAAPVLVVGVDGSASAWHALDWAADEAQRTERTLQVVHAGQPGEQERGARLLREAVTRVAREHERLRPDVRQATGDPADRLVELAADADLLVIGRGHHGTQEVLLGAIGLRAIGHAPCPVVVVADDAGLAGKTVVVGVSDTAGGIAALRFACEEARRRGTDVRAVRTYRESASVLGATGAALPLRHPNDWAEEAAALVDRCLQRLHADYPDVAITPVVSGRPVEHALIEESDGAALLVVGCRHGDGTGFARLGPHASWAVRHAPCPVVVVGHSRHAAPLGAALVGS